MTDLSNQIRKLRGDLAQRRAELAQLEMSPEHAAPLSRRQMAHRDKMRNRLKGEIVELERYIVSLARLVHSVDRPDKTPQ